MREVQDASSEASANDEWLLPTSQVWPPYSRARTCTWSGTRALSLRGARQPSRYVRDGGTGPPWYGPTVVPARWGLGLERGPVGCSEVCLRYRSPVPLTATTFSPPPYSPRLPVCRHNAVRS